MFDIFYQLVVTAFLATILFSAVSAINVCPSGWQEYEFACHYYNPIPLSFDNASKACNDLLPGSWLAIPRHGSEHNFISSMRTSGAEAWVGYSTLRQTPFATETGSLTAPYVPWESVPDGTVANQCAHLVSNYWSWRAVDCELKKPSLCMACKFELYVLYAILT